MSRDLVAPEAAHITRTATPAHVAMTVTADMPDDVKWKPARHLLYINQRITIACLTPEQSFIDLEVSVRHGKSFLVSGYLPFWYLGMFPDRRVGLLSYNADKAAEWGEFTRELMELHGEDLFGQKVDKGKHSKRSWGVAGRRGEVIAEGLGGTITGKGFDLVVIDDPIKNREEADSAAERKKLKDGYYSNVRTRLSSVGTVVLAMARWREDDLAGDIVHGFDQAEGTEVGAGDEWEVIRLPAIAEAPRDVKRPKRWRDVIGRKEGDALWPEMWPLDLLLKIRATMQANDPGAWDSLYQQNPTAKEGNDFKVETWITLPHVDRSRLRMVRFWDLAASKGKGDWTVGALVGMDSGSKTYVLDIQRFRKDSAEVEAHIRATAESDGITVPVRLEQEKSGSGKAVASTYKRLLVGFDVDAAQPSGSKSSRASAVASQQQQGRVILQRADWNAALIEECRTFPNGRHDDQVDALSGGFNFLAIAGPTTMETSYQLNTPMAALYGNSPRSVPAASAVARAHAALR